MTMRRFPSATYWLWLAVAIATSAGPARAQIVIWNGGSASLSSVLGSNTVVSGGNLSIATSADHNYDATAITNSGTVNWSGGTLQSGHGGSFTNNGTFNDSASNSLNSSFGGSAAKFVNAGIYNKTAAGNTTISQIFNNSGTVNITAGTMFLSGGGAATGGSFALSSGAGLSISSGNYTLDSGSTVTGSGTFSVSGGSLSVRSGEIGDT